MEMESLGMNILTALEQPLEMRWKPKEDITTFELAKCIPYILGQYTTMPNKINTLENHFRHFEIINHNLNIPNNN